MIFYAFLIARNVNNIATFFLYRFLIINKRIYRNNEEELDITGWGFNLLFYKTIMCISYPVQHAMKAIRFAADLEVLLNLPPLHIFI